MTIRLGFLAPLAGVLCAATAFAQPTTAPTTFPASTAFRECHKNWAFACNMRDAAGHTFGTAKQIEHCETYTFRPDGTFELSLLSPVEHGIYQIRGSVVTLTTIDDSGKRGKPFDLTLSADGKHLGNLNRL